MNDGGPAFPLPDLRQGGEVKDSNEMAFKESGHQGMSLRDYFAAAALTGLISFDGGSGSGITDAIDAYCFADAMLKEREKSA